MLRSVVVARYGGNLGGRKGVSCTFPRTAYRTWTSHATQMVETGLGGAANEARFRAERDLADNLYRSSANHLCPTTKACPARVLRRGRIPRERHSVIDEKNHTGRSADTQPCGTVRSLPCLTARALFCLLRDV